MIRKPRISTVLFASAIAAAPLPAAQSSPQGQAAPGGMSCAAHHAGQTASAGTTADKPESADAHHHDGVNERGDHVMGFDHAKTTHHFALTRTGGSIAISANDASDTGSIAAIRGHLPHIAKMFSEGDFEAPMLIHDRVPPGVPTMKRRPSAIAWKYEDSAAGGRVVATTKDPEALSALHAFFAFQIEDHETGDSLAVR
jgi:hypothetical protein